MFSNGAFAKVWDVQEKTTNNGSTTKTIRVSTSRKNEDGSYTQDFNGFVRLVGKAKDKVINNGDRVQFVTVGVTNNYDKEKNIVYTNYLCFNLLTMEEFEANKAAMGQIPVEEQPAMPVTNTPVPASAPETNSTPETPVMDDGFMNIPDGIDEELPFN